MLGDGVLAPVRRIPWSMAEQRSTEHRVPVAGTTVHAWDSGPVDGPVVVLTHGATMDHRMFDPQVPALTEAGYRVITWDLRGHGASRPLGAEPFTVPLLVEDLLTVLDHLGVTGPVVAGGQSLGGYVAQELVFRHPERVAALVIIGSTCLTLPISRAEDWALRSSPWWFRPWPWRLLTQVVARSTARDPAVQAYAAGAIGVIGKRDFLRIWEGVATCLHAEPGYRITQPILLLHGAEDRTGTIARSAPEWAARGPHCRYAVIPTASHNANQDNPTETNRLLLEFLDEHVPD